jgi:ABC-2 type transport system permease protein
MSGLRQAALVAVREVRERLRSPVYYASLGLMLVAVVGSVLVPSLLGDGGRRDVGVVGRSPADLGAVIRAQGDASGVDVHVRRYHSRASGEKAVRAGRVDVLVVDGRRLEWRRTADEELKAVVTGAIQAVAVRDRAVASGIDPVVLQRLLAPVAVPSRSIGQVAGRTEEDEAATYLLSLVLFLSVSVYGGMVLTGVVEEKSSRVVEVLLARIPSWCLLAGKVAGIGLLGLVQVAITGLGAVVTVSLSHGLDIPAARASVVAWAVVWFVVGYALFATAYGVLGSLTSRSEDASSVTGPLTVVLILAYFASFATIGSPDETWARLVSWFPVTAPFAMPNRLAMGAPAWWEPYLALVLAVVATAGLVALGGRVYRHAILRSGAGVKLAEAWRGGTAGTASRPLLNQRQLRAAVVVLALAVGGSVGFIVQDVVVGVAVAAALVAVGGRVRRLRH